MSEMKTFLALFTEIDPAVDALDQLREHGVNDEQMNVISGIPLTDQILGRPRVWSNVPRLALGGAIGGLFLGIFLAFGIPYMYPLKVGGQALVSGAPTVVVVFEMTMLGLLASTFIGVFLDSYFPSYRPKEYVPEISDGKIGVLFHCPTEKEEEFITAMTSLGVESIKPAEARQL